MKSIDFVIAEAGRGLVGDRYHGTRHRHVSVQSAEDLAEASRLLGRPIDASETRRNVTVSNGKIPSQPGTQFHLGNVLLEVVRVAAPCRLLEDQLGPGAVAALRNRAGSVCRVLTEGQIRAGDPVTFLESSN